MTIETLLSTNLVREFERAAQENRESPAEVLAEFMADYIESRTDAELDDVAEKSARKNGYTEADAVELVRRARRERVS